jgi:gp16 family phage-associated protein
MSRTRAVKSPKVVRAEFNRIGKPITEWARENGFKHNLVYEVLRGRIKCLRGKSHRIAVLLGMKEGEIERRVA